MSCTTILVGKGASNDGSTMIARNDDSGGGHYTAKKLVTVEPENQPRVYESVLSHVRIELPDNPMRYSASPNAVEGEGIWAAHGINAANVGMTATESICSNERVLAADPLVFYQPAGKPANDSGNPLLPKPSRYAPGGRASEAGRENAEREVPGGIGEEDFVVLVLPYIHSAREGVQRLGSLLAQYGTYEMNGVAFSDVNEVWWMETIGGHHWMARRVPDNACAIIPNQMGIDALDLDDALGGQREFMCSPDLREFLCDNHLALEMNPALPSEQAQVINPRLAFGTSNDADHVYNTPRAWDMGRFLAPKTYKWSGPDADYTPFSDDLPWCIVPERKMTAEDVKYILSLHFQGTPYDPYGSYGDDSMRGAYRAIGINRTDVLAILQIRPDQPEENRSVEWISFASNAFNVSVPFYTNVRAMPAYLSDTTDEVSTESFYWSSRLIAVLADSCIQKNLNHIEHYQTAVQSKGRNLIAHYDALQASAVSAQERESLREEANAGIAAMLKEEASMTLDNVLREASDYMKNRYLRSDH